MKRLCCFLFALAPMPIAMASSIATPIPHFDLDMTSEEYRAALTSRFQTEQLEEGDDVINDALVAGTRNLDWFKLLNASRDADHQLHLTSPETQTGHPIEEPSKYNPTIIEEKFDEVRTQMPQDLSAVLFSKGDLPQTLPVDDATYVVWARKLDLVYQSASRWKMMSAYLPYLKAAKANDIRGYYYLKREENLNEELSHYDALDPTKQDQLRDWLLQICHNSVALESWCKMDLNSRISRGADLNSYFTKYNPGAKKKWDSFFELSKKRSDIDWHSNSQEVAAIPFQTPDDREVQDFLSRNIQDEWRWQSWQLVLNFVPKGTKAPYIVFEAGATANAELAGSRITMDSNNSLSDYETNWTIRHEFGHTMGFPDCYVEFYDSNLEAIVNYQLDVNNLMCSRKGKFTQGMFDVLKKNYLRK